jgi:1-pyrroline-5-carboxylate dehydrogenase
MSIILPPFKNEPFVDFTDESNAEAMHAALANAEAEFDREYPLVINGEKITTGDLLASYNPSNFHQVVGKVHRATQELADKAIVAANEAFKSWQHTTAEHRASYLIKAAAELRRRKLEFDSLLVLEAGKSWNEAEADSSEAIDFIEFYARQALRFAAPQPLTQSPLPSELNEMFYIPLGAGIVIPPWNFPLAILAGMATAAVVAGNTVVLKPSSDTPVIAAKFFELMESTGLPPGVLNFLPCSGGAVGDFLVAHPQTRFISFTGSMEVGLHINELAAKTSPGQIWIKRVVAEMGGKDTIVVDETADLDAAAEGIVTSAFGYSGQKCSACSRAVIVDSVYDQMLEKVAARTAQLTVGAVKNGNVFTGPVASKKQFDSINNYIEIGKQEGRVVVGGGQHEAAQEGWYIPPTIIADVAPKARISQEEIFGPVLAVIKAENFDDALTIANNTQYGLTGAFYSSNRERIARAKRDFHVGNLYINRKCTGAFVDVHPFGGFNMSGTDSKAGGRDYLLLFLQAKSVAEKF